MTPGSSAPAGTRCCDFHGPRCEPPSELCCEACTEVDHPRHPPGVTCTWRALTAGTTVGGTPHELVRKPPGGGGGHTPGVGWMCTGCAWRFSYDVPAERALSVWRGDPRHGRVETDG